MKRFIRIILFFIFIHLTANSQNNFPGADIIGKGYNIFGEFANNKSIERYRLFDFSKCKPYTNSNGQVLPELIISENISDHVIKTIEGSSMKEYIHNLSYNTGFKFNAFLFKASVKEQFKMNTMNTSKMFYYTYMDINTKWRLNLDTRNTDSLIQYLDKQFQKDLETLTPNKLFELYGTHFITSAYLGGRIDYSSISEMNKSISTDEIKTAINAKLHKITGNYNDVNSTSRILSEAKTTTRLNVVGGNSEFAKHINNHDQYNMWAKGIKDHPVLCGFDEKSLQPIWTLTKSEARQNELKNYFESKILPKYPVPEFFPKDEVLDNTNFRKKFKIIFTGFKINNDCDNGTYLGGDEDGDFRYNITVYCNGEEEVSLSNNDLIKVWGGDFLKINQYADLSLPINKNSNIRVYCSLTEVDAYTNNEIVGEKNIFHYAPFSENELFNYQDEDNMYYWKESLYHSDECNADFYYQIIPDIDNTAINFGNKGWEEFEKGDYEKCLYYSKEALKIDNSLWYVHYNVALVYLIQNNPRAFEKYKLITNICGDRKTINAALQDIINYENNFKRLNNSDAIKLLLKSKI